MEELSGVLGILFGAAIGIAIFSLIISLIVTVSSIVMLVMSISEKNKLKVNGINLEAIKKITTLAIISLVISVFNCAVPSIVLSILGLVFVSSNAKKLLEEGNIIESIKKADISLIMLIISNACILSMLVINFIIKIIEVILEFITEVN